ALELEPVTSTINLGSKVQLVASGGVPPYTFSVSGGGHVDASGLFSAPSRAGDSELTVTDSALATASTTVRYAGSTLFQAGGQVAGTVTATVWSSSDGITWSPVGALPEPRTNGALIVFDDRMLYLGGNNLATVRTDTVFASTDGETWTQVGTLPE